MALEGINGTKPACLCVARRQAAHQQTAWAIKV
ncbi:MAG: hypothetical protein KatS3mg082_1847 [Nitrospiraceae bacterium]|nr:MAG: hypothetical protein KatS3mg082_1847 [Nitrospiraceae bacterium]